jgi:hypothetical protein
LKPGPSSADFPASLTHIIVIAKDNLVLNPYPVYHMFQLQLIPQKADQILVLLS